MPPNRIPSPGLADKAFSTRVLEATQVLLSSADVVNLYPACLFAMLELPSAEILIPRDGKTVDQVRDVDLVLCVAVVRLKIMHLCGSRGGVRTGLVYGQKVFEVLW